VRVKSVSALASGQLDVKSKGGRVECVLPVRDVTDILIVNE